MKTIEVVAAIIRDKDRILATQRKDKEFKGGWEFPGGKIEAGENHHQALIREIKEELDVIIDVKEHLIQIEYTYPNFHLIMDCYWAELAEGTIELKEHQDARWIRKEELDSLDWLPADIEVVEKIKDEFDLKVIAAYEERVKNNEF